MKRTLLLLLVLAVSGTVIFAGGGQGRAAASDPGVQVVRWSFWGSETRIRNTAAVIDKFTEETGIVIAMEPAPGTDDHFNKFRTQFAGGNAVDIVQLGGYFTNLGVPDRDLGAYLLPLDPLVASGHLDISNIDASAIAAGTRNGTLYAIPLAANMPAWIYNKSMLQRAGAPLPNVGMTLAEFEAWMAQVQPRLPQGVYVLTDMGATQTGGIFFAYWLGQKGTPQIDATGTSSLLTVQAVQEYLEMWNRWRAAGYVPPASVSADYAETNESTSALIAGRTVIGNVWSNQLVNWQASTNDELELILPVNAVAGNAMQGQMSQMMAINRNSRFPQAAAQWISYRVNEPSVWRIMGADPGTPVTPAGRAAIANDPIALKINAYLDVAGRYPVNENFPNMPSDTEWTAGLFLAYQNYAFGRITSAQAAQQIVDLANRLIAANR